MYYQPVCKGSGPSIEQQLNDCCIQRILSKDAALRAHLGRRIAELEVQLTGTSRPEFRATETLGPAPDGMRSRAFDNPVHVRYV